jgi:hypothetical protein
MYALAACVNKRVREHSATMCANFFTNRAHILLDEADAPIWADSAISIFEAVGMRLPEDTSVDDFNYTTKEVADMALADSRLPWLTADTAIIIVDISCMHYATLVKVRSRLSTVFSQARKRDGKAGVKDAFVCIPAFILIGMRCMCVHLLYVSKHGQHCDMAGDLSSSSVTGIQHRSLASAWYSRASFAPLSKFVSIASDGNTKSIPSDLTHKRQTEPWRCGTRRHIAAWNLWCSKAWFAFSISLTPAIAALRIGCEMRSATESCREKMHACFKLPAFTLATAYRRRVVHCDCDRDDSDTEM